MSNHTITIAAAPEGFIVTVTPPVPGFDFDKTCPSYRYARTFARGVRLHRGFPIIDQTNGGAQ